MAPINIRNNVWDPTAPSTQLASPEAGKKNYILVQLKDEMDNAALTGLANQKVTVLKRMEGNTWLCTIPAPPVPTITTVPQLAVAVVYDKFFKIHASLKAPDSLKTIPVLGVVLHEDATSSTDEISRLVKDLPGVTVLDAAGGRLRIRTTDNTNLERIAGYTAVQAIEIIPQVTPANFRTRATIGREAMNAALAGNAIAGVANLTGLGRIVGMADSGLDATHYSFPPAAVAQTRWYPGPAVAAMTDPVGHGTHVASTILGRPNPQGNVEPTSSPGIAPAANIAVQALDFAAGFNTQQVFTDAYAAGARIHNNSWGAYLVAGPPAPAQPPYTVNDAEIVDTFAYQHPDFTILFAAGNNGSVATDTGAQIGAFAAAKNAIVVGATPSTRNVVADPGLLGNFRVGGISGGEAPGGANGNPLPRTDVCNFSNRGPTREGWLKPDIVAPGQVILGAHSRQMSGGSTALWNQRYGQALSPDYAFCTGTSMACPAVSGCCALLREGLALAGIANPSSALIKAILINFASPLPAPPRPPGSPMGAPAPPMAPRTRQGFGEVNMSRIAELLQSVQGGAAGTGFGGNAFAAAPRNATCGIWMGTWAPPPPAPLPAPGGVLTPTPAPVAQFRTIDSGANAGKSLRATLVYIDWHGSALQEKLGLTVQYRHVGASPYVQLVDVTDPVNGPRTPPNPRHANVQKVIAGSVGDMAHLMVAPNPHVVHPVHFAVVWDFIPPGSPTNAIPPAS